MPRSGSRFPLSRGVVLVCSSLQIVLAVLDAITRLQHPQFSPMHWLLPSIMLSCGICGLVVQSPASNLMLRPVVVLLNIVLFILTGCGVLVALSVIPLDNIRVPFVLLLFSFLAIVPGWINLIAISMLPSDSGGMLY